MEGGESGLLGRFPGADGSAVLSVAAHPLDTRTVAVGEQDGDVWLWHFRPDEKGETNRASGHHHLKGHTGPVWTVAFSKDACLLASGSSDGTVRLWNVQKLQMP